MKIKLTEVANSGYCFRVEGEKVDVAGLELEASTCPETGNTIVLGGELIDAGFNSFFTLGKYIFWPTEYEVVE